MEHNYSEILARFASKELQAKPFPLKEILRIYLKNESWCRQNGGYSYEHSLYSQYFLGFRKLVNWLGPIEIPAQEFPEVPSILLGYEITQMAHIVGTTESCVWHLCMEIISEH